MSWFAWGLLLLAQNASFTWVSRARNSASPAYTALASVCSNGIWFIGQMFIINVFIAVKESGDLSVIIIAAIFYTLMTTTGTFIMQNVLLRTEKGKKRVGARK